MHGWGFTAETPRRLDDVKVRPMQEKALCVSAVIFANV